MKWTALHGAGLAGMLILSLAQAPVPDPLTTARRAYNERRYEAAISAAQENQITQSGKSGSRRPRARAPRALPHRL